LEGSLFALKKLRETKFNTPALFQNEVAQLKRFNGLVHEHLVTLLASFTLRNANYFIFPHAEATLEQYWEELTPEPRMDLDTVRWVSRNCAGIIAAIDHIHNPTSLSVVKRYGRHGDIKPDNILWFRSSSNQSGLLVVSDFGLTAFNRDTSRSNIPNENIPGVPGYRPPECDLEGGTISRAFDIWTLGCLYLELLTWLLGGKKLLQEFQAKRSSIYITGVIKNIFFDLKEINGQKGLYVAQVKTQVTQVRLPQMRKLCES
jgi:serine/threonine protein kinase